MTDSPFVCNSTPNKTKLNQLHLNTMVTSGISKSNECFHNS